MTVETRDGGFDSMHRESYENMQYCYDTYVQGGFLESRAAITLLDIGSSDVNGTYRPIFRDAKVRYVGVDLCPGAGVDVQLDDPYRLPFPDASADIIISGQMLEHCEFFWQAFHEMVRVLKQDGLLFLIAPSAGPIHRHPVDCYRFYPDAYQALARFSGCSLLNVWRDDRGPWHDLVGVFSGRLEEHVSRQVTRNSSHIDDLQCNEDLSTSRAVPATGRFPIQEADVVAGSCHYLDVLKRIHAELMPERYFEIGVAEGHSLELASNDAIGVDVSPSLKKVRPLRTKLFRETSDLFFKVHACWALADGVDLGFIDGMHRFEFVLRDFMNLEGYAHPTSVFVIDDILPNHPLQAARKRQTRYWCGDVWKIERCLKKYRPDLLLLRLDASPVGMLIVAGLNKSNTVLRDSYDSIVKEFVSDDSVELPHDVTERTAAFDPNDPRLAFLLNELRELRCAGASSEDVRCQLEEWCAALFQPVAIEELQPSHESVSVADIKKRRRREIIDAMSRRLAGDRVPITSLRLTATRQAYAKFTNKFSFAILWRFRRFHSMAASRGTIFSRVIRFVERTFQIWNREGIWVGLRFLKRTLLNRLRPAAVLPNQ